MPGEWMAVSARSMRLAMAVGLCVAAAAAQSGPWREVASVSVPPARTGFALVAVPGGDLLMIGGNAADATATDWAWDGIDWRPLGAQVVPRRDDAAACAFGVDGAILFGGVRGDGTPLNDTWRLDGSSGTWVAAGSLTNPPPLSDKSMVYDADADRAVLIGIDTTGGWQTWFYAVATGWQAGPSFGAAEASLLADPVRREVLLITGRFPTVRVERLEAGEWNPLAQATQAFSVGEAAFDTRRGRAVLVQPSDLRESVEWDGLSFLGVSSPAGSFVPAVRTAMAYDARRAEMVLVTNYAGAMQTWRYVVDAVPGGFYYPRGPVPVGCGAVRSTLLVRSGDVPQPGTGHRLRVDGATGTTGALGNLMVLGFSHVESQGAPLPVVIPFGASGCELLVDPAILVSLGAVFPQDLLVTTPASPSLVGVRYDAQALSFDVTGIVGTSNGLEVQLGLPLVERQLIETFQDASRRDPLASGDSWQGGAAWPAQIGGDGRHGSFDPTHGVPLGEQTYEWSTDNTVIPGSHTLQGQPATITDGRFYFTDFEVPAGVTVRFTGSRPAQVFVRGRTRVLGTVSVDADDMPFFVPGLGLAAGERVSDFDARGLDGQPGGAGGPGGGRGGDGGRKCLNAGPILEGGVNVTNGQPGDDVQVSAAHAYAGTVAGTGGQGSALQPPTGIWPGLPTNQLIANVFVPFHSAGGSGGGYVGAGSPPVPFALGVPSVAPISSPLPFGGGAFAVLPYPSPSPTGYSSLEHFAVGGSGGGGGGSHGFGRFGFGGFDRWLAGHGGSGGGGVLVLRSGAALDVAGLVSARGGRGVVVNGDDPSLGASDTINGISSPGGGGSGGSILMQSADRVQVSGALDVRGGEGSRNDLISQGQLNGFGGAGAGANGYFRAEAPGPIVFGGTSQPAAGADNSGALDDQDDLSGSRSLWLLPPAAGLPVYLRYELLVDVNGVPVLFSDDADVSPLAANDASGPVLLRFQGAALDPVSGGPAVGSEGPWRTTLARGADSVNRDRAQTLRFDLVTNKSLGVLRVLELRIVWR